MDRRRSAVYCLQGSALPGTFRPSRAPPTAGISGGVRSCPACPQPIPVQRPTMLRLDRTAGSSSGVGQGSAADPEPVVAQPVPPQSGPATRCRRSRSTRMRPGRICTRTRCGPGWELTQCRGRLEFQPSLRPAINSVVVQNGAYFSHLAAALGPWSRDRPTRCSSRACFDANEHQGLGRGRTSDCWELTSLPDRRTRRGIDFNGDGIVDLKLCVQVNTNGDGVTLTQECADRKRKDLFVEIDYMQYHKPDPKALSQTQSVDTLTPDGKFVGVKSVREAFAAAPLCNPSYTPGNTGIRIRFRSTSR